MKFLFTIIVLASFIGMAAFSIFGMHMDMQNRDGGCVAAKTQGMDCVTFHMGIFKNFSPATFLILSLLIVGVVFGVLSRNLTPPKFARHRIKQSDSFNLFSQFGFFRWLALHENSPAIIL